MTEKDNVKTPKTSTEEITEKEPKVKVKVAKVSKAPEKDAVTEKKETGTVKSGRKLPGKPRPKSAARPPIGNAKKKKDVEEAAEKTVTLATAKTVEKAKEEASAKKEAAAKKEAPVKETPKAEESKETKAEAPKKAEPKKKPAKKKNADAPVRRQEIKIVKSAEAQRAEKEEREKQQAAKREAEKKKRAAEKKERAEKKKPNRNGNNNNAGGRNNAASEAPASSDSGKSSGRRGSKDRDKNQEHDKFSKLEKKQSHKELRSLEKKARKKHVKQKPEPEPEPIEELVPVGTKVINVPITIAGFAEQADVSISKIIMALLKMGVVANQNQNIDETTVEMLAEELGISVVIGKVEEEVVDEGLDLHEDREKDLVPRSPVITVMGHVDHGKTSLLDAIRSTNVTAQESGGITQHIGASEVEINGQKIVFLDTPGHEAFTAMRARGADITDIAVLVVAADDSVKPQTVESISHAKAAGVPVIVAINKMDKPGANPDIVKKDLSEHGLLVEDWGGDVISVPVSAKTGEGIKDLLEMILLQAEVLELKANPNRLAMGTVLEARLDKTKGPVSSLLVTNGTLKTGQSIVAGTTYGRIRLMTNAKGETIRKAGPATAVEILGLNDVPAAGDTFNAVGEDKKAREIAENRQLKQREEVMATTSSTTLEELFSNIQEGEVKELNLLIKADVHGSVGAIVTSLEKLSNENVKVRVIHSGVGAINDSDVTLAGTSQAIIIGFNVRPTAAVSTKAENEGVQIRTYRVIYDIINDVEAAMTGMLDPEFKEEVLGECQVRETFKVPNVGIIAGAYVTNGKIVRNKEVRLVRDGVVIHEGKISSLRRFKDDAKEVAQGYECGIGIENYNDIKEGDMIECFHMVEVERK